MRLGFGFEKEAAKPKGERAPEDGPTQAPMRPIKMARNPSTDQKKVRRQMQRKTATETGATMNREADILAAMAKANPTEQRRLMAELDVIRANRREARLEAESVSLADAVIHDHLTPVLVHEHHTAATDWVDDYDPSAGQTNDTAGSAMLTEASLWFGRVSPEVKADRAEFAEQARGVARRLAGQYGTFADLAERTFLDHVAFLHRRTVPGGAKTALTLGEMEGRSYEATCPNPACPANGVGFVHDDLSGSNESDDDEAVCPECDTPLVWWPNTVARRKQAADDSGQGVSSFDPSKPANEEDDPMWSEDWPGASQDEVSSERAPLIQENAGGPDGGPNDSSFDSTARRRTAADGQTCAVCGDAIERDPAGEDNRTWHHSNGETHDHEAKPSGQTEAAYNPFSDPESAYNNPKKGPHKGTPDDLFPDGVPLHGDLTPEQQAWLDGKDRRQRPLHSSKTATDLDEWYGGDDDEARATEREIRDRAERDRAAGWRDPRDDDPTDMSRAERQIGATRRTAGERRTLTLPYSEVCMSMGVAGKTMQGELTPDGYGVQLYDDDGTPFSFPITRGEAGWDMQSTGRRSKVAGGLDNLGDAKAPPFGSDDDDDDKKEAAKTAGEGVGVTCPDCKGRGKIEGAKCSTCLGSGKIPKALASKQATDADQSGQGVSSFDPSKPKDEDDDPAWPWELADGDPETGTGAADVANAKNPNDHTSAKTVAFRSMIQANLARKGQ